MSGKYFPAVPIGIVTGLLSLYVIPSRFEIGLWLVLLFAMGWFCGRAFKGERLFVRAFVFAVITGVFVTLTHMALIQEYLDSHAEEIQVMGRFGVFESPRIGLLTIAPVYWVVLGLLTGIISTVLPVKAQE